PAPSRDGARLRFRFRREAAAEGGAPPGALRRARHPPGGLEVTWREPSWPVASCEDRACGWRLRPPVGGASMGLASIGRGASEESPASPRQVSLRRAFAGVGGGVALMMA